MPVEGSLLDAMLGTFRNMVMECRNKNLSGEDFDQMQAVLQRMEQLGQEMNDISAYSGQLVQENLFARFSDHYGKLLSAEAKASSVDSTDGYNEETDKALLNKNLQAYREAIIRLKENKKQVKEMMGDRSGDADVLLKEKAIIDAMEKLVQLGESGISYPVFLSEMIRRGLDKALDGAALVRDGQVYLVDFAKATAASPYTIQREEEKLELFDALSTSSGTGVPDHLYYTLGCDKIDWKLKPDEARWKKIKEAWEQTIFWLDEWVMSFCSFAPSIDPWALARNPSEAVVESQECVPGKLRVWEKIIHRYFEMTLRDLFRHPSFAWDVKQHWLYWSQEYVEFLLQHIEPVCQPGNRLADETIAKAASFHMEKRKVNPMIGEPGRRVAACFDKYFGEGEYKRRFGVATNFETNAARWDYSKFSF